jgi:hypothetical protein
MRFKLIQTNDYVYQLWEYNNNWRQIALNVPQDPDPALTWYGNAVGKWDGDTLVVDSVGYKDSTWLDARGLPPIVVVFPELIHVVVGLNHLEAHRVQRDARVAVRIRVLQRRIGGVGEVLVVTLRRPLGLELCGGPRRERNLFHRRQSPDVPVAERAHPRA